jgi:DNA-binding NarL/FixJ family response regulator
VLRILIADDHEVARKGIRSLLESHADWEICAEARDGREAVEYAARLKPDVLLLDIGMPNLLHFKCGADDTRGLSSS